MSEVTNQCVTLTLKAPGVRSEISPIDGSGLSVSRMAGKSELEISKYPLHEKTTACIGDLFGVVVGACVGRSLVLRGDLSRFHHLATSHDRGTIEIDGDAGDDLGGAMEGCRSGMSGGRILVRGRVGDRVGYRMRRGEIFVAGDAGDFLAAHMVAGTLCVAGQVGDHIGYAMRRGSLLLASEPSLPSNRFSRSIPTTLSWLGLMGRVGDKKLDGMLGKMASGGGRSCRGDAAANGIGELVWLH